MLRAGVDGIRDGAARAELPEPVPLAVTILTSDDGAPKHVLPMRIAAAVEAGCGGVVCAATDVAEAKLLAPRLTAVVPGIRPAGSDVDDQRRVATPAAAFAAGADLLVIGRAVTRADDRVKAAEALISSIVGPEAPRRVDGLASPACLSRPNCPPISARRRWRRRPPHVVPAPS